ncbi:CAIB/BAIF family acyl-CoA transferase [Streptomyces himastatinicus ATCC 53653]|uniref:CAIB/BAIF family acyl-CoA transferase n=1 Tax=Streptomyces himastatinicus ATCC 53653 TaxID=457427 RepID=D9WGK8_9ACTN|nr:CoA transferase [Streptomyces himastatinicus]EFL25396.1 CAIB/BAIF family acyl-CoA transferase [Streptomyces himastatinicus ATCC 53653]
MTTDFATAHAWAALGGAPALAGRITYTPAGEVLAARLPVRQLARATVGVCSLAAAELAARRGGGAIPAVRVEEGAVATAFISERHLLIDGRSPTNFAPLSGFWRAADGWVRTHANYPHHRARLLAALGLPEPGDPDALAAELAQRPAREIQETAYAAGALAVAAVRPEDSELPLSTFPLVESWQADGGTPTPRPLSPTALPAAGVRVLDLTRVIAGPVATRTLALLGADVLRVDSPQLPEDPDAHADTGFGKRSTRLDLADPHDRRTFDELLAQADVVVTAYRPGALDRYLTHHPGLIVAQLNAWGWTGEWADRRGFDSLVQAGTGIAQLEATADGHPRALPAQALDHGTGYLIAAGVLRALTDRAATGTARHLRFSLAGTASWLMHGITPTPPPVGTYAPDPWLTERPSPYGHLRHALPPIAYDGAPRDWTRPPGHWGTDTPTWV